MGLGSRCITAGGGSSWAACAVGGAVGGVVASAKGVVSDVVGDGIALGDAESVVSLEGGNLMKEATMSNATFHQRISITFPKGNLAWNCFVLLVSPKTNLGSVLTLAPEYLAAMRAL